MSWKRKSPLAAVAALSLGAIAIDVHAEDPREQAVALAPGDVQWKPDPRAPGMYSSVLSGDPKQPGLYVLRVKMTEGARLPPHRHPDVRYVTVITGEIYLGFGEAFDVASMKPYPAGSLIVIPANVPHFGWVKSGESITQDCGWGPTGSSPVAATASGK